jgi:3-(3-hydroxy-phenyl)propionate hydroxylase
LSTPHLLVAGAGPVGVVAALHASQLGFRVTLIEEALTVDTNPRAATTHPSTLEMIARLGILDEFIAAGLVAHHFEFWDRVTRTRIARYDHAVLADDTPYPFVVQTEQHKLANIGLAHLARRAGVEVHLGQRVTSLEQDERSVTLFTEGPGGPRRFSGDWLVGADGGRSTIRKALDIPFEGYTWPERFIVLTTPFDFEQAMGCCLRTYFADPDEWTNLFKVSGDDGRGRWRAVFPTRVDETDEEALADEAVQARLNRVLPQSSPYPVVHRNIYHVHQRVAARFRGGRAFLAGDSAHVNNPIGGLGLNCGIHDATELIETLHAVAFEGAGEALLDRYERRRRPQNIEYVQQQTVANKKRLEEREPAARQARFDELRAIEADPARQRQFLMRTSLLESARKVKQVD